MNFFTELRRRKVIRVAAVYAVVGWIIIQVANATFADFGIPVWAYRFVVLMLILGFPVVLIITWAFELTPEGIKTTKAAREESAEGPANPGHQSKRNWLAYATGAAVPTLLFGVIALFFYFQTPNPDARTETTVEAGTPQVKEVGKSIAVLPFDNRSNHEEDQYFTDGIHDDLLTHISHIREIKTISRTSVMGYRDTKKNMRTIGEELGVATILEGGVQRAGDQVRINVQLIDAATDAHLWAEIYTRELTAENIFTIQSEIAGAIADALQAILSPEEQDRLDVLPTTNLAALEAYFRAVTISLNPSSDGLVEMIGHYQRAIELDPEFALAYARLAGARVHLSQRVVSGFSYEDQIAKAQSLIDKAMEIDPHLSEAYDALGLLRMYGQDFTGAEAAYKRAIELNPNNAVAYNGYSRLLSRYLGDAEQALAMKVKALELSPNVLVFKSGQAFLLGLLGRLDEARTLQENLVRDYPETASFYFELGYSYSQSFGLHDQAVVALRQGYALDPGSWVFPWLISTNYELLGATEDEVFWLKRALALAPEGRFALRNRIRLHIIKGELATADALWWRVWESGRVEFEKFSLELLDLMNADFAAGRFEAPRARYFERYPDWFEPDAVIPDDIDAVSSVMNIARALIATGERQQADYLLDQLTEILEARPENIWTWRFRVQVPAIKGEQAEAMRAIHQYVAITGVPSDGLYSQVELEPLRSLPEFQAVFGDVIGKRKEQLEHLRAMESAGELAPIPELPANKSTSDEEQDRTTVF